MTPLLQWASKVSAAGGKYDLTKFQWFDATNVMQDYFQKPHSVDVLKTVVSPMPFNQMFVCLLVQGNKMIIRIEEEQRDFGLVCSVAALGQTSTGESKQFGAFAIIKKDGVASVMNLAEQITTEKDINYLSTIIAVFQDRLRYQSVSLYQPYIKNSYTNQRLIKKGKPPTFEWKLVTIEPKITQSISLGGTHASPRLHDRRGHWRTMKKSGKRVWVKQCKVGDPSKGVIIHDYKFNRQTIN